jgi:hypothetical protein
MTSAFIISLQCNAQPWIKCPREANEQNWLSPDDSAFAHSERNQPQGGTHANLVLRPQLLPRHSAAFPLHPHNRSGQRRRCFCHRLVRLPPRNRIFAAPGETTGTTNLSDELSRSKGVICPRAGVDPGISAPAVGGGIMPVIPPPGTPGGDPSSAFSWFESYQAASASL